MGISRWKNMPTFHVSMNYRKYRPRIVSWGLTQSSEGQNEQNKISFVWNGPRETPTELYEDGNVGVKAIFNINQQHIA